MPRTSLIFGNGLGMALNSDYFRLGAGLRTVWDGSDEFREEHKRLITSAIPGLTATDYPESEDQLDRLQVAIVASEFLRGFESADVRWLSDESRELPQAFKRFVHEVATYFHESNETLPENFADGLSEFIKSTKSHVAVLNYDNLLYDALQNSGVLSGYNGALIDGFHRQGFAKENLDRRNIQSLGWYLHLHGSPLFVGNRKLMRGERHFLVPNESSHIVLTHVVHKPLIIASSKILSEYWVRFSKALRESRKLVLFGYSGADMHLNEVISSGAEGKEIHVFEWEGAGQLPERQAFWSKRFEGRQLHVHLVESLLEFDAWNEI